MADGSARASFVWGDGETHEFRLAFKQLRELQDKCDAGPYEIYRRLGAGNWRVDDIREVIKQGLIGGGKLELARVMTLIERYVEDRPLLESVIPARMILHAALVPAEEQDPGGDTGKKPTGDPNPTGGSPSAI